MKTYQDGKYTVTDLDGDKFWFVNGKYHREDGPAVEFQWGSKMWYINDQRHRENGPAVENAAGDRQWWFKDKKYSENEHKQMLRKLKLEQIGV